MNNIVKKQLEKLGLPTNQTTFFIPRKRGIKLQEDHYYLIKVPEQYNPNEVWITNWNQGSLPSRTHYKVDVSRILNDMVRVVGIGYDPLLKMDLEESWSG